MKKRHLVYGFILVCLAFCSVQIFLYGAIPWFGIQDKQTLQHEGKATLTVSDELALLRDFLAVCHSMGLPVFLIDPAVLRRVVSNESGLNSEQPCKYLCVGQGLTSLGVLREVWSHQRETLDAFRAAAFSVTYFYESDPDALAALSQDGRPARIEADIPSHYLFGRRGHVVHLVVFYERSDFWWHGPLRGRSPHGDGGLGAVDRQTFQHYAQISGAFDKTELVKVTVDGLHLRAPRYPTTFLRQVDHSAFLECNHSRAKLFHSLHGQPQPQAAEEDFVSSAKNLIQRAAHALNNLNIRFWISSGTCLGWFRQCDVIPHSLDVDLGMWIQDFDPRLVAAMETSGLRLKHRFGKENDSLELSFQDGDVKLDIFFFYEDADCMWNGGTQTSTGKKFKYIFPKFTLCWTEFLGLKLRVPCDTETYILANYGPDWFKPVRSWDWKRSPPNVRENGVWPEAEWPYVIQTF